MAEEEEEEAEEVISWAPAEEKTTGGSWEVCSTGGPKGWGLLVPITGGAMTGEPGSLGGDMVGPALLVLKLLTADLPGPGGRPTVPAGPLGDILGLDLGLPLLVM